uniref:Homocysteine S-methyltransferase n=1 Tax=Herpetomonas muscarum TaxID=5718 RepID=U5KLM3_HERMU|nr:homocysteine S-methyltransferase [Herpetomonas muscarum]
MSGLSTVPPSFKDYLADPSRIVVLDGALATELESRGCDLADPLWSGKVLLDAPELIRAVEDSYLAAGARCLITASYQATPQALQEQRGISEAAAVRAVAQSVESAKAARDAFRSSSPLLGREVVFVAGSVGPYGAYLADGSEYRGEYTLSDEDFAAFHRPRIAALVGAGADILALETQPSAAEVRAVVALLASEFPAVQCWVSFTVRAPPREGQAVAVTQISDGTPIADIAHWLSDQSNVVAVGFNCIPLRLATAAVATLAAHTSKPMVVYPNSGEIYDAVSKTWSADPSLPPTAQTLAACARDWVRLGARVVGGCCRTGPHDIQDLAEAVRQCQ